MKASKFSDAQKAFIIKQGEDGTPVAEICRKAGIRSMTKKSTITLAGGAEAARWLSGPEGPRGFNSTAMSRMLEAMSLAMLELEDDYRAAEAGYSWDPAYGFAAFALDKRFNEMCVTFRRAVIRARHAHPEHQADAAMAATIVLIDRCLAEYPDAARQPAIEAAWIQMQRHRAKGNTPFSRTADRIIHQAFARLMGLQDAIFGVDVVPDGLDPDDKALSGVIF